MRLSSSPPNSTQHDRTDDLGCNRAAVRSQVMQAQHWTTNFRDYPILTPEEEVAMRRQYDATQRAARQQIEEGQRRIPTQDPIQSNVRRLISYPLTRAPETVVVDSRVTAASRPDVMSGVEFERHVANVMSRTGFFVVTISGGVRDEGADITARDSCGRRIVVQCKRYTGRVGSPAVQAFAGTVFAIHGADVAMLVSSSSFTSEAVNLANRLGIRLIDGACLKAWELDGRLRGEFEELD